MSYIYVSADEFSAYMPDDSDDDLIKEDKKICLALLKSLIKEGRSAGIFIILGLQVSTYEEMPTIIRRCCNVKVSFKQSDKISSNAIINCGDAIDLEQREFIILTDNYRRCKTPTINLKIIQEYIGIPKVVEYPTNRTSNITTGEFISNNDPVKKIKIKLNDNTNYGQLPRGRKKGVLKDVNTK